MLIKGRGTAAVAPCNYRHRKQVIQEKIGNPKDVPAARWISWGLGGKVLGKGFGASCRQAQPRVRSLIARFDDSSLKKRAIKAKPPLHGCAKHAGGTSRAVQAAKGTEAVER